MMITLRSKVAVAIVVACALAACGPSYKVKTVKQIMAESSAKTEKEKQALAAKADACAAGNCADFLKACQPTEVLAMFGCREQLKRVRNSAPDAILPVYKQLAIGERITYLELSLWALLEPTGPATPKVDALLCDEITTTTWGSDADPTNGERDDVAQHRAQACDRRADRLGKTEGADPGLAKVLELRRKSCEIRREVDPEDDCAALHNFARFELAKANAPLAAATMRPWCDAAKPKRNDHGAQACLSLAEIVATSPSGAAEAIELAKKACTFDRALCAQEMSLFQALTKQSPEQARKLAEWLAANKTSGDVRGADVLAMAMVQGVGGPKDQAKAAAIWKELCTSLARGAASSCFMHCTNVPAPDQPTCREGAKRQMEADTATMTQESQEDSKARSAHNEALAAAAKGRREAFEAAKPKPKAAHARAAAAADDSDDDDDATTRPAKKAGGKKGGGGSSKAGQTGSGMGMGMSRDLACAVAKLNATQSAGCDNLTSAVGGASCDCSKIGIQFSCSTSVTCR